MKFKSFSRFASGLVAVLFFVNSIVTVDLRFPSKSLSIDQVLAPVSIPPAPGTSGAANTAAGVATLLNPGDLSGLEFTVRTAKDSRGRNTVEVVLRLGTFEETGDVPAGASTGGDEAFAWDTKDPIQFGIAKQKAAFILSSLKEKGFDISTHEGLIAADRWMIENGGENFKKLGANATVPVSRALWKMAAKLHDMELYEYIRKYEPFAAGEGKARFLMNVYNGGLHALEEGEELGVDRIPIQEIMAGPDPNKFTYEEQLAIGDKIDQELKKLLNEKRIFGYPFQGFWRECGNPLDYFSTNMESLNSNGTHKPRKFPQCQFIPPIWVGKNCTFGKKSVVGPNVILGEGCRIGAGAKITDTIVWDQVSIRAGELIEGSIVGKKERIQLKSKL